MPEKLYYRPQIFAHFRAIDRFLGRGSSVVERTLGKGEVESSILSRGTIYSKLVLYTG